MGREEHENRTAGGGGPPQEPVDEPEPAPAPPVKDLTEEDAPAQAEEVTPADLGQDAAAADPEQDVDPGQDVDAGAAEEATDASTAFAEVERERDEYLDLLRRERAEFDNYRRRANRERMEAHDRGAESVVSELVGVLDNYDRVLSAAEHSEDEQLVRGVEMVYSELRGVLSKVGLEEVPGAGAPFDPNWHEAMMQVEADEPVEQPTVFEVLRTGYRFKGRVLRPAAVSVAQ